MAESMNSTASHGHTRRGFVSRLAAVVVGAFVGLVPLVLGVFTFLDPLRKKSRRPTLFQDNRSGGPEGFLKVCSLAALPENGPPQRFPVIDDQVDAWNFSPRQPIGSVYIQRTGDQEVRVFNTTCPHAGCSVSCAGDAFNCPCHNSAFALDGSKLVSDSGRENPSPRDLDRLVVNEALLEKGEVWVEFKEFYTGREDKVAKS